MGLGLQIDQNGHNIAFTGGTGILVFLDLVAMLLLQACEIKEAQGIENTFGPNFKFTLYFAAPCEEQAIGLQLCRDYYDLCNK